MQPSLLATLPRAGSAPCKSLIDARRVAAWREAGRPGTTLPLHRYRLPRHELQVAEGEHEHERIVSLDGRPVGRVWSGVATRGPLSALSALRAQKEARAGSQAEIRLGEQPVSVRLLTGRSAGDGGRRIVVQVGDRAWTVAERTSLPHSTGIWRGEAVEAPVACLRRDAIGWEPGATIADLVLLECLRLRYPARELELMLRRFTAQAPGEPASSVLAPLSRLTRR